MGVFGMHTVAKSVAVDRRRTDGIGIPSSNRIANETNGNCEHFAERTGASSWCGNAGPVTSANLKNGSDAFLTRRDHVSAGRQQDCRPHSMMSSRSNLARLIKSAFSKIISSRRLATRHGPRLATTLSVDTLSHPIASCHVRRAMQLHRRRSKTGRANEEYRPACQVM